MAHLSRNTMTQVFPKQINMAAKSKLKQVLNCMWKVAILIIKLATWEDRNKAANTSLA